MAKIKTTREEYNRFLASDAWKDGMFIEFDKFEQDRQVIEDSDELVDGVCYLTGGLVEHDTEDKTWSLVSLFDKWRKQQDTVSLSILVKKDEIVEMKVKLKALGVIIL